LLGNPAAYANHEKFVLQEVVPFIERNFGVSHQPKDRAVAGYSNGGDWAASMAVRNPGVFDAAIVMSPSISVYRNVKIKPETRFYISAGLLEPHAINAASCLAAGLLKSGTQIRVTKLPYGHSFDLWQDAFVRDSSAWLKGSKELQSEPMDAAMKCRGFD
jgi:enterochelin esterase-like enzyme